MEVHRAQCESCQAAYRLAVRQRFEQLGVDNVVHLNPLRFCLNEGTLLAYLAGSLESQDAAYIKEHTAECLSCSAHVQMLEPVAT